MVTCLPHLSKENLVDLSHPARLLPCQYPANDTILALITFRLIIVSRSAQSITSTAQLTSPALSRQAMAAELTLCTVEKRGRVHVITLAGAGEHRLNPSLLAAIRSAVAAVRASPGAGALVVAAEGRFFCNGYDLAWARGGSPEQDDVSTMRAAFRCLLADLLALPVPTVAAVTGHAAGAGCGLALATDAVVMRASRGFLYMSEVDAGIKFVDYFAELVRQKVPGAVARRDLVMKGEKMTAAEAVRRGIVDAAVDGGVDDVVAAAVAVAEGLAARGWDGETVAEIRKAAWPALWSKVKDYGGESPARPRL